MGAICLSRFCAFFRITHPEIDSLVAHSWAFARIASPDEFVAWDRALSDKLLHGLGDPGSMAVVDRHLTHIRALSGKGTQP
jgi:hypothetical protein